MNQKASNTQQQLSRRTFLSTSAKAAAVVGAPGLLAAAKAEEPPEAKPETCPRINIFSKHLQWLDYDGMAETAAEVGGSNLDSFEVLRTGRDRADCIGTHGHAQKQQHAARGR